MRILFDIKVNLVQAFSFYQSAGSMIHAVLNNKGRRIDLQYSLFYGRYLEAGCHSKNNIARVVHMAILPIAALPFIHRYSTAHICNSFAYRFTLNGYYSNAGVLFNTVQHKVDHF